MQLVANIIDFFAAMIQIGTGAASDAATIVANIVAIEKMQKEKDIACLLVQ